MADEIKDQRIITLMTPSELEAIDDWAFKNQIRSRGEAIRRLCQIGMALDAKAAPIVEQAQEILRRRTKDGRTLREMNENLEPGRNRFKDLALSATTNALRALEDHARLFTGIAGLMGPILRMRDVEDAEDAIRLATEARGDLEALVDDLKFMKDD